jgi:hypothetical protein
MKQQVSPVAAAIVIVVVLVIAGAAYLKFGNTGPGSKAGEQPPGMPASVQEEFARLGAAMTGGKPTGGGGPQLNPGGGNLIPPPPPGGG